MSGTVVVKTEIKNSVFCFAYAFAFEACTTHAYTHTHASRVYIHVHTVCTNGGRGGNDIYIFLINKQNSQRIERESQIIKFCTHGRQNFKNLFSLFPVDTSKRVLLYTRSNCTPRIPRRTLAVLHTCKKPHFCTNYPGSTHTSNSTYM